MIRHEFVDGWHHQEDSCRRVQYSLGRIAAAFRPTTATRDGSRHHEDHRSTDPVVRWLRCGRRSACLGSDPGLGNSSVVGHPDPDGQWTMKATSHFRTASHPKKNLAPARHGNSTSPLQFGQRIDGNRRFCDGSRPVPDRLDSSVGHKGHRTIEKPDGPLDEMQQSFGGHYAVAPGTALVETRGIDHGYCHPSVILVVLAARGGL